LELLSGFVVTLFYYYIRIKKKIKKEIADRTLNSGLTAVNIEATEKKIS